MTTRAHVVDTGNAAEARDAVRDILMLYVDLADDTAGFGHGAGVHVRFDPLKFVDAEAADDGYYHVDLDLLRAGSAIAILCRFYDLWCEEAPIVGHPAIRHAAAALAAGRLARFPDIAGVLREALARGTLPLDDPWFDRAVLPIYRSHVLGFFARLAASDRTRAAPAR